MMAGDNAEALKEEQTLAHLLVFLARLQEKKDVRDKVIQEIAKKVKRYITNKLTDFADEGGSGGYLFKTIEKSKELRKNIVMSEEKYEHYNTQFQDSDDNKYAQQLIDNIFPLFGCLYYMYFECAMECSLAIKGGDWQDEKCDEISQTHKKHLHDWLNDTTATERMIERGFKGISLSEKRGSQLFQGGGSGALLYYLTGGHFQNALCYMLFLPSPGQWNPGQSGHAVLFLKAFCEKVTGSDEFFKNHYRDGGISMDTIKSSSQTLKDKISAIAKSGIIAPVAVSCSAKYDSLLEAEHFSKYMEWLEHNLQKLIDSLQAMENDVTNWDKESLKTSKSFGPYPWGFTFAYNWDWLKKEELERTLNTQLPELITALQTFKEKVQSLSAPQSKSRSERANDSTKTSSTASTVGGVAGTLGAVGAGAAAAYSGVLGPAAEAAVRALKALFL